MSEMSANCFTLIERHQRFLLCLIPLVSSVMCLGFGFRCLHKKRRHIHDEICKGVINDTAAIVMIVAGVLLILPAWIVHRYFNRKKILEVDNFEDETGPFNISQTDELIEDTF